MPSCRGLGRRGQHRLHGRARWPALRLLSDQGCARTQEVPTEQGSSLAARSAAPCNQLSSPAEMSTGFPRHELSWASVRLQVGGERDEDARGEVWLACRPLPPRRPVASSLHSTHSTHLYRCPASATRPREAIAASNPDHSTFELLHRTTSTPRCSKQPRTGHEPCQHHSGNLAYTPQILAQEVRA